MSLLLAQRKPNMLLLLAGFFFLLGVVLLCSFGSEKLSCIRVKGGRVDCLLTRSVAFGFVKAEAVSLSSFKEARVDTQIKRTRETTSEGQTIWTKAPVYGVLLSNNETAILDGYSYNREQQQKIVDRINSF